MTLALIDYSTATAPQANRHAAWAKAADRLQDECWPEVRPSFRLARGAKVFTIGSCFARNIEEHIHRLGFRVPMLDFAVPGTEWPGRPNGILNKYTATSIFQLIDWAGRILRRGGAMRPEDCELYAWRLDDGSVVDSDLVGLRPVSPERFIERRRQVYETVAQVFSSDCVVITPGLAEAWYDPARRVYVEQVPVGRHLKRQQDSVKFVQLDFATSYKALQDTIDLIREINPVANILLTTSPVPLGRTFTTDDVLIANTYAKSMLRAVCGELTRNNLHVDYFPSYESVMLTRRWDIFEDDLIHVTDAFVAKIVARLTSTYLSDASEADQLYQQSFAQAADKDVTGAIETLRRAMALEPDRATFHNQLGWLLHRNRQPAEAHVAFEAALALDPGLVMAHRGLASTLEWLGDNAAAQRSVRTAIALGYEDPFAHIQLGQLQLRVNQLGEAETSLRTAIAVKPSVSFAHYHLGRVLRAQGRTPDALAALHEAVRLQDKVADFYLELAQVHAAAGQPELAIEACRHALECDPDNAAAQRQLGELHGQSAAT